MSAVLATRENPLPAEAAPPVVRRRLDQADSRLDRFRGQMLDDGRVNLIPLDVIAERLGARWAAKRESVYEQVERVLERRRGTNGYFLRVSDTDFLVALPDLGRFAAQATCIRALSEIYKFFLGAAAPREITIHQVTDLRTGEVVAAPVDPGEAMQGELNETRAQAEEQTSDGLLSPERWSPFVAANGRRVRVSCVLEPVFELKNNSRIGFRLNRRVLDMETGKVLSLPEIARLSRADLLRIDMATIARGLARLSSGGERQPSLIIPVSYVSLASHEGRTLLSEAFAQVRATVRQGVICEIWDMEDVPQSALLQTVSLIKPRCLFVVGLANDPAALSPALKDAGLQAISINCPPGLGTDADFIGWLRPALQKIKRISRSVMVYACETPRLTAIAAILGATHASIGSRRD